MCLIKNEIKKVNFIVSEDISEKFEDLIGQIRRDFNDKINFDFYYFYNLDSWCRKQQENFKSTLARIDHEKISAVAFNTENVVMINKYFWDKCEREQICIIIHELGHIRYPLAKLCTFLTTDNGENGGREFLADSYIKEVGTELISQRFEFWFKGFNENFNVGDYASGEFNKLIICYFYLYYFKKLVDSDLLNQKIKSTEDKLLEWSLSEEEIRNITKYINKYLDSYCDWENGKSLTVFLKKIDSTLLSKTSS